MGTQQTSAGIVHDEIVIRSATANDAVAVAAILAESFPALYRATFGRLDEQEIKALLIALYRADILTLEATRLALRGGSVVGLAILHIGQPIGRGTAGSYWRAIRSQLRGWRALRTFCGGLAANQMLNGRIPGAPDLVYIEALAVGSQERGRGIGTRLLGDAEQWARERGRRRLALHVLTTNTRARRLYERIGFQPWQREKRSRLMNPGSTRRTEWGAILMQRRLDETRTEAS